MSTLKFPAEEKAKVDKFVTESPNSMYLFDAPHRGAKIAELCRSSGSALGTGATDRKNNCISVAIESRHLFEYMQKLGFFCQLPFDPARTEIECRRIELVAGMPLESNRTT
ncbi:hypothetical protein MJO29_002088 [Puccinia striiformis f. sp. tritici]|uniref:Uncharacterized protein n=3 Tax=Puccinia striiformis TaxID=27350 RepID=A0A2S4VXF0_9BASI|nr:hypothetical protein Pst134EB_003852 [Puccinia striiformis f. sp. tritici]KAI9610171.1 hypothetical protein H4Q26_007170 [Puccinia striiformis f. sp. tritici PST-130]KNE89895.1 hypothetical protein PSTG_16643 [Puccinia striiformis f. sp. tritici PST-78]POV95023.1 hypothetical protein PSTT_16515 [Puccinia striiformis]KAI7966340.1 hypothetical protein MJO29_002088 [Puccinia striiformis f. sp. tritici]